VTASDGEDSGDNNEGSSGEDEDDDCLGRRNSAGTQKTGSLNVLP
jgi:hypothetical protein